MAKHGKHTGLLALLGLGGGGGYYWWRHQPGSAKAGDHVMVSAAPGAPQVEMVVIAKNSDGSLSAALPGVPGAASVIPVANVVKVMPQGFLGLW